MLIDVTRQQGVAHVLIRNRRMNTLTDLLLAELDRELNNLASDDSIDAIILAGAGTGFSAGGDYGELESLRQMTRTHSSDAVAARIRRNANVVETIRNMPQLTIAAISGPCIGAALALACACDIRVADPTARFATGFLSLGLSGDLGAAYLLAEVVGPARATQLLLLADRVDPDFGERIGLITSISEPGQHIARAAQIAASAPRRVNQPRSHMKANLRDRSDFGIFLDNEATRMAGSLRIPREEG